MKCLDNGNKILRNSSGTVPFSGLGPGLVPFIVYISYNPDYYEGNIRVGYFDGSTYVEKRVRSGVFKVPSFQFTELKLFIREMLLDYLSFCALQDFAQRGFGLRQRIFHVVPGRTYGGWDATREQRCVRWARPG